jgi:hypothetical protein
LKNINSLFCDSQDGISFILQYIINNYNNYLVIAISKLTNTWYGEFNNNSLCMWEDTEILVDDKNP